MSEELEGSVERITYYNPENGYGVLRLRPIRPPLAGVDREGLVTIVGSMPELNPGEELFVEGHWNKHPRHGLQFEIKQLERKLPITNEGIQRYLGSGLIKGIGPRLAERLVEFFGDQTLDIIENHPQRLLEVPDIGPKRSKQIADAWSDQMQVKNIMLFLHAHKVSTNLALKIYKQYGDEALEVVNANPYRLANDIHGVGFKIADKIAQDLGLAHDHPARISAGVLFVLEEATSNGHVYFPEESLIERSADLLQIDSGLIPDALLRLQTEGQIAVEQASNVVGDTDTIDPKQHDLPLNAVYLKPYHFAEIETAKRIFNLSNVILTRLSDIPPAFTIYTEELTAQQMKAVQTTLTHPVSVLTGGPGTGKTTTLKALISILDSADKKFALASPTGRAAKRLSQAVGKPASTVHRLLGYSPRDGYKHNDSRPLNVDIVVVDEASMLDLTLMHHLMKAIPEGAHLLLVGDVDQIPSVGAGDVLRDIIASDIAPITRLDTIFRQAADSLIIANAHRINQGDMPIFPKDGKDFFFFPSESPESTAQWILDVTSERIPRKFNLDARDDIQVLSPMYRGPSGVDALNTTLQAELNPPRRSRNERTLFGRLLREDDKVMQTQNNYDKDVFNGDIGRIVEISEHDHTMTVAFDDRRVDYDWSEVDQLVLAYAISVHKSQGAEFPAVVVPVITQHYLMLQRNLLYTAISRAQKLCVLVGTKKAIGIAVKNDKVAHRHSALAARLVTPDN